jgi:hypothetical protein
MFSIIILLAIVLYSATTYQCHAVAVQSVLQANDRVLFIGGTNVFMGSVMKHGFVNVFQSEARMVFQNVTVFNGGARRFHFEKIFTGLDLMIAQYNPSKVVLLLDHDNFNGVDVNSLRREIKRQIEHLIVKILGTGREPILCSAIVMGEQDSGDAVILEEYLGLTTQLAIDYNIMHIDIYSAMCKYLEFVNVDNQPQSILTHNGLILNERGHFLVASTILSSMGVSTYKSNPSNVVASEHERIKRVRAHRLHVKKNKLFNDASDIATEASTSTNAGSRQDEL